MEGRSFPGHGFNPDPPPVSLGDLLADRQPNTRPPVFLYRMKSLKNDEDSLEIFRRDADPVIRH